MRSKRAARKKESQMKVRVYVQADGRALIEPLDKVNQPLPQSIAGMRDSSVKTRDADIDDSIIGVDRDATKRAIAKDGCYINHSDVTMQEKVQGDNE